MLLLLPLTPTFLLLSEAAEKTGANNTLLWLVQKNDNTVYSFVVIFSLLSLAFS